VCQQTRQQYRPARRGVIHGGQQIGIGKNYGYELVRSGDYPVRVIDSHGRFKVSKFDLLRYLGAGTLES
jgi:hypothetical protein